MRDLMLVFALLFGAVSLQAGGPMLEVKGLTFNTQLMLEMYNVSQQNGNNGQINSYPANLDPGVVTVRVTNLDQGQAVTPCFQVLVREPGIHTPRQGLWIPGLNRTSATLTSSSSRNDSHI